MNESEPNTSVPDERGSLTANPADSSSAGSSHFDEQQPLTSCIRPARAFLTAAAWTLGAWIFAIVLLLGISVIAPGPFAQVSRNQSLRIAVGSLLVALVALLPGVAREDRQIRRSRAASPPTTNGTADNAQPNRVGEFVAGVLIRLAGTIALFMFCRYQMPASDDILAAWVLGWYVWLVSVEVVMLCRAIAVADEFTR